MAHLLCVVNTHGYFPSTLAGAGKTWAWGMSSTEPHKARPTKPMQQVQASLREAEGDRKLRIGSGTRLLPLTLTRRCTASLANTPRKLPWKNPYVWEINLCPQILTCTSGDGNSLLPEFVGAFNTSDHDSVCPGAWLTGRAEPGITCPNPGCPWRKGSGSHDVQGC